MQVGMSLIGRISILRKAIKSKRRSFKRYLNVELIVSFQVQVIPEIIDKKPVKESKKNLRFCKASA